MNGMTRENEMAATTMKPNHQAPTHVGSAGVMSRLVIMKKTKEENMSIQIMSNWKYEQINIKLHSNLIGRDFLYQLKYEKREINERVESNENWPDT